MKEDNHDTLISGYKKVKGSGMLGCRGILMVFNGKYLGKSIVVGDKPITIGRDRSCSLCINDPMISKKHCRIFYEKTGYYIEDLQSTNATFINAKKNSGKKPLDYGDRVVIGKTIMRFFLEEDVEVK